MSDRGANLVLGCSMASECNSESQSRSLTLDELCCGSLWSPKGQLVPGSENQRVKPLINVFLYNTQNVAVSLGTGDADYAKMKQIVEVVPEVEYICVDVANGYSEHFVQFVRDVRKDFPKHTIIVSMNYLVAACTKRDPAITSFT